MDHKKTDYGNWVPLALMKRLAAIAGALLAGEVLLVVLDGPTALTLLVGGLLAAAVILWLYMLRCRVLFDFNRGGLMGQVHQYLTDHLPWDGRGTLLDIGCGSGALTIRCAKRFPNASLVGVDYWGAAWSYAKEQCQQNAAAEGVSHRVRFQKGDAAHLAFPDETFEAAVSNFVFHEVRTQPDKREVVREALRVVKKGGCFAFQDLFEKESLYGDMTDFLSQLRQAGVQELHYIPHVEQQGFIPRYVQAPWMLSDVGLLYGRK